MPRILFPFTLCLCGALAMAETHVIDATKIPGTPPQQYKMGTAARPDGRTVTVSSTSLLRDGKPWLPVMGEFHYARYPANEWRDELLKMKAGGIDIAATYVFWIHHEEVNGLWDWTGQRSLRDFVTICKEIDLPIVVRCGPWCHGEVRNGGIPDWAMKMGRKIRSDDPDYLAKVKLLYAQIADQLKGLLWKDGGPVIGIQLENEYGGRGDHLMSLKKIARDVGLDVPLYTRTGWPQLLTSVPVGEILPLYGGYAEGFWDREITAMPGRYWQAFILTPLRTDVNIGADQLGQREARDAADVKHYPYLTCELGGGMPSSYHRRIWIDPRDIYAVAISKVGSGSNLPGYYMYHGGTNPIGKLSTLNETQATNYHNDLPTMTYDFQAPLGEFGQARPHYHLLRRLHLFLYDFGEQLTSMRAMFPAQRPKDGADNETLRWSIRTDGKSGFVFVNNYQRLLDMPEKKDVQFEIKLSSVSIKLPLNPITIPGDSSFFWPFNMDLDGARLIHATAQPICRFEKDGTSYFVFVEIPDVPAEFVFDGGVKIESTNGIESRDGGRLTVRRLQTGPEPAIRLQTESGKRVAIIFLDETTSLTCWKLRGRVVLSRANLSLDGPTLRVRSNQPKDLAVQILPAEDTILEAAGSPAVPVSFEPVKAAGPVRAIKMGSHRVAEQPSDADYQQAAAWRIKLPPDTNPKRDLLLRIKYTGDVARLELGGKLLTDNFYNGDGFEVGLKRFAPDIYRKELVLKVLPMPKDAPIYISHWPQPDGANLDSVEVVETIEQTMTFPAL
jgi:hypothetical protein